LAIDAQCLRVQRSPPHGVLCFTLPGQAARQTCRDMNIEK